MAAATPPPMPPAAIMVIIIMKGKTSAKPASASVPRRPKMKVSAMATKVCATITAVVGAARFHRLLPIGAVRSGWATWLVILASCTRAYTPFSRVQPSVT